MSGKKNKPKAKHTARDTAQLFDLLFKRLMHLSNKAVVSFINGLFSAKHKPDSEVVYLPTETVNTKSQRRTSDIMLRINGATYHIEAEIRFNTDMTIRIFEYGFSQGQRTKTFEDGIRTIALPHARVIYWETSESREEQPQILRLKFPDKTQYDYKVETFNLLTHSVAELEKRGLAILLPFYLLKMRKLVRSAKTGEERKQLSAPMAVLLEDLLKAVDGCQEKDSIEEADAQQIVAGLDQLYRELFSQYEELAEEEDMAERKLVLWTDRIKEEHGLEIAKNFLAMGDSPEKVAKATGLPLRKIKALLQKKTA